MNAPTTTEIVNSILEGRVSEASGQLSRIDYDALLVHIRTDAQSVGKMAKGIQETQQQLSDATNRNLAEIQEATHRIFAVAYFLEQATDFVPVARTAP